VAKKTCTTCNTTKSTKHFNMHKSGKYGVGSICKLCLHKLYEKNKVASILHYVYMLLDENQRVIYVGKTDDLKKRINSHYHDGHLDRLCYIKTKKVCYQIFNNDIDATICELYFINKHKAEYNKNRKLPEGNDLETIIIEKEWNFIDSLGDLNKVK
jgi:predicted GIY-YIG superfamily endonuclease